jgi:DNA primase
LRSNTEKIEFLKRSFGFVKISREGSNVAVKCPSCGEKKGKFSINIDTWMCHCWVCGVKSKNLYFILKKHTNRSLAEKFSQDFGCPEKRKAELDSESIVVPVTLPDDFILLSSFLGRDPDVRDCISYCKSRGLSERDLWYFRIGTSRFKDFKRRVIIPSFDIDGELNYFVSRSIDIKGFPRYVNAIAKKTEIIFNEINIDWSQELSLVEGAFDLIKSNENSTCLLGSKLSENSKLFSEIIKNKTPILIALDPDMQVESHKIAQLLFRFGCIVRMLNNKTGKDVGEMSKERFLDLASKSPAWSRESSLKFKIHALKSGSLF